MKPPIKKNDEIMLDITALTSQGSGVGHFDGFAVFVEGAAVGDRLLAHIIKVKSTYAVGVIRQLLRPSRDRVTPACPVAERCGGCSFQHISYAAECEHKRLRVQDALQRIGSFDLTVDEFLTTPHTEHYRNKAQYPIALGADGRTCVGFYAKRSHRIVDCRVCALQPPEFSALLDIIVRWAAEYGVSIYDEERGKGLLRHIYLRKGFATGDVMVCLVVTDRNVPHTDALTEALLAQNEHIKSVVLNVNAARTNVVLGSKCHTVFGSDYITDTLCGLTFQLSPLSFYQVNPAGAEILYRKAADLAALTGEETVLDLYCGTGTIGLSMAHKAKHVIGVEIIPQAIENAKENAKRGGIENAEFFCADAAQAAAKLLENGTAPDVVILDPPRKGCSTDTLQAVAAMGPDRIVYVSCDPATLARDCKTLQALGYTLKTAVGVDMFPRTVHVETVVLLCRKHIDAEKQISVTIEAEDGWRADSFDVQEFRRAYDYNNNRCIAHRENAPRTKDARKI